MQLHAGTNRKALKPLDNIPHCAVILQLSAPSKKRHLDDRKTLSINAIKQWRIEPNLNKSIKIPMNRIVTKLWFATRVDGMPFQMKTKVKYLEDPFESQTD